MNKVEIVRLCFSSTSPATISNDFSASLVLGYSVEKSFKGCKNTLLNTLRKQASTMGVFHYEHTNPTLSQIKLYVRLSVQTETWSTLSAVENFCWWREPIVCSLTYDPFHGSKEENLYKLTLPRVGKITRRGTTSFLFYTFSLYKQL